MVYKRKNARRLMPYDIYAKIVVELRPLKYPVVVFKQYHKPDKTFDKRIVSRKPCRRAN